jgi:hypothetical protein
MFITDNLILRSRAKRGVSIARGNPRAVMGNDDGVSHPSRRPCGPPHQGEVGAISAAYEVAEVTLDNYLSVTYRGVGAKPPWPSRVNSAGVGQCKKRPSKPVQNDYRTTGNTGNSLPAAGDACTPRGRDIAYDAFRRLDRSAKRGAERPSFHDGPLIVERGSLRSGRSLPERSRGGPRSRRRESPYAIARHGGHSTRPSKNR